MNTRRFMGVNQDKRVIISKNSRVDVKNYLTLQCG